MSFTRPSAFKDYLNDIRYPSILTTQLFEYLKGKKTKKKITKKKRERERERGQENQGEIDAGWV